MAQVVPHGRLLDILVRAGNKEHIVLPVQVNRHVGMEVNGGRAGDERAVVVPGIENLHSEGFPAAGRASIDESSPSLADAAKLALDSRDQLGLDGIPVRTQIRGIYRIRVVVKRICMLDRKSV